MMFKTQRFPARATLLASLILLAACSSESTPAPTEGTTNAAAAATNGEPALDAPADALEADGPSLGRSTEPRSIEGFDLSKLDGGAAASDRRSQSPPGEQVKVPTLANRKARISGVDGAPLTIDFGAVKQGEKGRHVFQLLSDGTDDLVIEKIKPNCGCTLARTSIVAPDGTLTPYQIGGPIPVGSVFEIETELKTDGRSGPLTTQVQITGNTPEPVTNLRLKAQIQPILEVGPNPNLNLGHMTSNMTGSGSLTITSGVLEPFRLAIDEKFVVEPMAVTLTPVDPDANGRSTDWKVDVTLGPNIPEGFRNYPLRFTTDAAIPEGQSAKNFEARAYVQADVTGLVKAEPGFVSFGVVRPGQEITRKVKLVCYDDFKLSKDMAVELEPLQKNVEVSYLEHFEHSVDVVSADGSMAELTVTLKGMPEDFNASFGGLIRVLVGHPEKPDVSVRFSGVCRQGVPAAAGQR
ncbi:MAG: DUF1573 domain-containing protein [Planctomycetota bacterium]